MPHDRDASGKGGIRVVQRLQTVNEDKVVMATTTMPHEHHICLRQKSVFSSNRAFQRDSVRTGGGTERAASASNSDRSAESAENTRRCRAPLVADTAALSGAARSTALVIWLSRLGVILCGKQREFGQRL